MNMKHYLFILLVLVLGACKNKDATVVPNEESANEVIEQKNLTQEMPLDIYDFNGFKSFLNKEDDKIYVINFWATWCAPCVKELPYFEELNANYKSKNVEVILVSLDFPHLYDELNLDAVIKVAEIPDIR